MAKRESAQNNARATACLCAALAYLGRGWSVIPVEPRGKRPLLPWLEFQQRRAERSEVQKWFRTRKNVNVAIVTGKVSKLVVLDIDARHGGQDSLDRLEGEHGAMPSTIEALTGGGGRHIYFRHPGARVRNRVALEAGVDLRGDGGCVVAPPSVHGNGKRYEWKTSRAPGETDLAPMPDWLLESASGEGARAGHSLAHWRALVRDGIDEGQRNSTIASLAGHLFHRGVDAKIVLELMLTWNRGRCRPPLSDQEVARVVESIAHLHERGKADDPFEQ